MTVFKKQKRIEITIALVVFVLAIAGSMLYIFLKTIPDVQRSNIRLSEAIEEGSEAGIQSIRAYIRFKMTLGLFFSGLFITISNVISFLIFRSFTRLIPKKTGIIVTIVSSYLYFVLTINSILLALKNISGIVVGITADVLVLLISLLYFYLAFKAEKDYY